MNENQFSILIAFVAYLLFMLSVGWYFYKKTASVSDYLIAGRKMNSWVTSLSAQASDMSGWLMMGLPGYAFAVGLEATWIAIGLFLGTCLNWFLVAKPLRIETEKLNAITIPGFLEKRFKDESHVIRVVASVIIIVFFLIYTSSGFVAGAKLFHTIFNVNYQLSLIITAFIIVGYTFLGGLNAVSWTDFFQGILMFLAVLAVPALTIWILGGVPTVFETLELEYPSHLTWLSKESGFIVLFSNLAWGLGYFGQPHILIRFMAIEKPNMIKRSRKIALVWVLISLAASIVVGVVGRVFFVDGLGDAESVFLQLANVNFPPIIAGVLLAAILAAIMSTADSQLLVTSSSVSEDFIQAVSRKKVSDLATLRISRFSVLGVAIIGMFLAWNPESSVLDLVAYAWAGFGATFGPVILLALYWKGMNKYGAIVAMLVGAITVLIWKQLSGGIFDLYEIIPGFLLSFLSGFLVSARFRDRGV